MSFFDALFLILFFLFILGSYKRGFFRFFLFSAKVLYYLYVGFLIFHRALTFKEALFLFVIGFAIFWILGFAVLPVVEGKTGLLPWLNRSLGTVVGILLYGIFLFLFFSTLYLLPGFGRFVYSKVSRDSLVLQLYEYSLPTLNVVFSRASSSVDRIREKVKVTHEKDD